MLKYVYIETYGCQMNIADSDTVMAILKQVGFESTNKIEDADVVMLNTCSVRDNAEKKIWNRLDYLKGLKRKKKSLKVGIIGCMAQRTADKLAEHTAVDFVAGPDSYRNLPDLIKETDMLNESIIKVDFNQNETYSGINPHSKSDNISTFISITRGCDNFCTYCIVPYTRGRERSRDFNDILNEVKSITKLGFKEVCLLGQNVNSYKSIQEENNISFPELIALIAEENPNIRIRFTTSHPKDLSDNLIQTISKYNNICNHIHLPFQSGSNKILKLMNRQYTREWYIDRVNQIRHHIPDCGLSTDAFCGFSTETEDDFLQTLGLMKEIKFDSAFMFKYSVRPGTIAAKKYKDDVPESVKIDRLNRMIDLQNKISLESNQKEIGKVLEVLTEGFSKKSNEMLYGRSQQNKVVVFAKENHKKGDIVKVKIDSASQATLKGKPIK